MVLYTAVYMAAPKKNNKNPETQIVRVTKATHSLLVSRKRGGESLSDVIQREIKGDHPLLNLMGIFDSAESEDFSRTSEQNSQLDRELSAVRQKRLWRNEE